MDLPNNYDALASEKRWQEFWVENNIYKFDEKSEKEVFSIDTPPPTVSGAMHLGHAFSYAHEDIIARYKRMKNFSVFYPFGTDDNGLATERLVEKMKKVKATTMDREEFINLCLETLKNELRPDYIKDWKRIGMSCDFDIFYTTISPESRKISQAAFLDLVKQDRVYRKEAPVIWCPTCATALSQVEIEDVELDSSFNEIIFTMGGDNVSIATTRPELLPACVAVLFYPGDKRYTKYLGKKARVPLFGFEVPIFEDERVDPEKGTGIVMCCTFGDQTDMEWQKAFSLPIKEALTKDGKMTKIAGVYEGLSIKEARKKMIEDMKEKDILVGQKAIRHAVNTHERCGTEVEFMHSKQWFIRYLDLKETFLRRGKELNWYPEHMRNRYENWINGLQWDWCISRQRFSGVPFPIWYEKKTGRMIYASLDQLPVDPLKDLPKGYSKDDVIPEKDVMDTWATSSLTPHLAVDRYKGTQLYDKLFPMSLRPQAHDIITFWLFNTVVRSHIHDHSLPWKDVMISGWALDPKGKKMSKSKGNAIAPQDLLDKYGADALRFWASGSKLGEDSPYQEKDLQTGKKTVTKLWNASKFSLPHLKDYNHYNGKLNIMDRWILSKLHAVIKNSTLAMDRYEYSKTKQETENFFWNTFCDNYLEIIKDRLYNPNVRGVEALRSAQKGLNDSLLDTLKLFAPIMPHITEEIYQMHFAKFEGRKSIHVSDWPEYDENLIDKHVESVGDAFVDILSTVRKFKSDRKLSLKADVSKVVIECNKDLEEGLKEALEDLKATAHTKEVVFGSADVMLREGLSVSVFE